MKENVPSVLMVDLQQANLEVPGGGEVVDE